MSTGVERSERERYFDYVFVWPSCFALCLFGAAFFLALVVLVVRARHRRRVLATGGGGEIVVKLLADDERAAADNDDDDDDGDNNNSSSSNANVEGGAQPSAYAGARSRGGGGGVGGSGGGSGSASRSATSKSGKSALIGGASLDEVNAAMLERGPASERHLARFMSAMLVLVAVAVWWLLFGAVAFSHVQAGGGALVQVALIVLCALFVISPSLGDRVRANDRRGVAFLLVFKFFERSRRRAGDDGDDNVADTSASARPNDSDDGDGNSCCRWWRRLPPGGRRSIALGVVFVFALVVSITACTLIADTCLLHQPTGITTKWSRGQDVSLRCSDTTAVCFVYLTLPERPASEALVNWHAGASVTPAQPRVLYSRDAALLRPENRTDLLPGSAALDDAVASGDIVVVDARFITEENVLATRFIVYADLVDLRADTDYFFVVATRAADIDTYNDEVLALRTLPRRLRTRQPLAFAAGGDMSTTETAKKITRVIVEHESQPAFVAVGGDLAYGASGFGVCRCRWDDWIADWAQDMRIVVDDDDNDNATATPPRLVPLLPAIGNHDGGNRNNGPYDALFALSWLPTRVGEVPSAVTVRPSYHRHELTGDGDVLMLVLDSGHVTAIDDSAQLAFIEDALGNTTASHVFTIYHVPAYPSVRRFESTASVEVRQHWLPLFDRFGVELSFENHDHAYSRTHPMHDERVSVPGCGTTYLGDGSMGTEERAVLQGEVQSLYQADVREANVVNMLRVFPDYTDAIVLSADGAHVDNVTTLPVRYVPASPVFNATACARSHADALVAASVFAADEL